MEETIKETMKYPGKAKCFVCGSEDAERVYLKCVQGGLEKLVCVRCLPMLIHGAH